MDEEFPPDLAALFRPVRRLAAGGMGAVWEVEQISTGRSVALKLPHLARLLDPEERRRFNEEAAITARLDHPHIVRVMDWSPDGPWIAYELLPGPTLERWLALNPPSPSEVVRAGREIALALECAHAAGVVHRDIKPENVIAGTDGAWKVTDFGVARWDANPVKTKTGIVLGTPPYIAPELVAGDRATPAADLYALGVLLYRMLTGQIPHNQPDPLALLMARLNTPVPPVLERAPGTPPRLAHAVDHLLKMKPAERTPSATALLAELQHALARRTAPARAVSRGPTNPKIPRVPPPAPPPPEPAGSDRRRVLALSGAIFAGGILVAGLIFPHNRKLETIKTSITPVSVAPSPAGPVEQLASFVDETPIQLATWSIDPASPRVRAPLLVPHAARTPRLTVPSGVRFRTVDGLSLPDGDRTEIALPPLGAGLHWLELEGPPNRPLGSVTGLPADLPDWRPPPPDPAEALAHDEALKAASSKDCIDFSDIHLPGPLGPPGSPRHLGDLVVGLRRCSEVPKYMDVVDDPSGADVRMTWTTDAEEVRRRTAALITELAAPLADARPRWDAWHLAGWIFANLGQRAQARRAFLRALRTAPNPWTWLELARLEERDLRNAENHRDRAAALAIAPRLRLAAAEALERLPAEKRSERYDAELLVQKASRVRPALH